MGDGLPFRACRIGGRVHVSALCVAAGKEVKLRSPRWFAGIPRMIVRQIHGRTRVAPSAAFCLFALGAICSISAMADPSADRPVHFELPSRPLAQALDDLSGATGIEILYDSQLARHRRSGAVSGTFTAYDALQIMLRGTGLAPRIIAPDAITLIPESPSGPGGVALGNQQFATYNSYFRLIQRKLEQALCRVPDLRPGNYRTVLEFWINPAGQVVNPHVLGSTASAALDRRMSDTLANVVLAQPPEELQQPVMIVILPQQSGVVLQCEPAPQ
jgi:hypothetical protein